MIEAFVVIIIAAAGGIIGLIISQIIWERRWHEQMMKEFPWHQSECECFQTLPQTQQIIRRLIRSKHI